MLVRSGNQLKLILSGIEAARLQFLLIMIVQLLIIQTWKDCGDKIKIAELFAIFRQNQSHQFIPKFVDAVTEWGISLEEKVVLKKNFCMVGKVFIYILLKDITKSLYSWDNILLQEFIDSSIRILE